MSKKIVLPFEQKIVSFPKVEKFIIEFELENIEFRQDHFKDVLDGVEVLDITIKHENDETSWSPIDGLNGGFEGNVASRLVTSCMEYYLAHYDEAIEFVKETLERLKPPSRAKPPASSKKKKVTKKA